ncbi:hypothetical protein Tco_0701726 [Tanacetum coccineum]
MSEPAELIPSPPTFAVRNTVGKGNEQISKNPSRPVSDAALREYCDKYYHQLLPIIAEKVHQEKVQQEKLKEVKSRLNFEGCSGRNSKIQEVSQNTVPSLEHQCKRGSIEGERRSGQPQKLPSMSSTRTMRWGAKKRVLPLTTQEEPIPRVSLRKEQNPYHQKIVTLTERGFNRRDRDCLRK